MAENLSPFVYWAQTENNITLKVDLKDVRQEPIVNLSSKKLQFSAHGQGAKGPHNYAFSIDFFSTIVPEESHFKVTDRQIDFTLRKETDNWWSRLTAKPQKPAWLKIDFDRWKSEDDIEDDVPRDIRGDYPDLYEKLEKEEFGFRKEDVKKVYLAFYNFFQFIGYTYILIVMGIRYYRDGPDSMAGTYQAVGSAMKFCQLMQILEVMHPLFGYTKGGILPPFMQVSGRSFMLFAMIDAELRMQDKPVVFYLFFVWSLVEVVRYPYYIAQVYKKDIGILTWLRYTMWIPLYPLGFLCEGVIILRNIPYFEETQKFTVSLPNSWNFAFHFPSIMRLYLLVLFFPAMFTLMSHMYRSRIQKLGPKKWRTKIH